MGINSSLTRVMHLSVSCEYMAEGFQVQGERAVPQNRATTIKWAAHVETALLCPSTDAPGVIRIHAIEIQRSSIGRGGVSTLVMSIINCTTEVSTQASFKTARISQSKWLIMLFPQRDNCNTDAVSARTVRCHVSQNPWSLYTNPLVHDDRLFQGVADDHIPIICYCGEEYTFSGVHGKRQVHLRGTSWEWDGVFFPETNFSSIEVRAEEGYQLSRNERLLKTV